MYFGEDIEVRGTVSPKLAYNLNEYQHVLHFRFPKAIKPVDIKYTQLKAQPTKPKGVGTTFSGGVDSLFTLWKHLPQTQSDTGHHITHGIFIQGFDIVQNEGQNFRFLCEKYNQVTVETGIELIPLETNITSILHKRLTLPNFYGPVIIGAGAALAGGFCKFIVPSSWDYEQLQKTAYSSDPLLDHFLSTDTLDVIHHGSTHSRVEKTREIVDWEVTQKILWVCEFHKFEKDTWNCSRCEKCVRTMIPIYALGKIYKFKSFEKPFKTNRDGLWWARKYSSDRVFMSELFPFVKKYKPDWLPWLRAASILGNLRYLLVVKLLPGFMKKWLRRYGYFINRNDAPDAYENPEVTQQIREHYDHSST
jgi:hypothetical protein